MRHKISTDLRYPNLWRGCIGAWCPALGPSGSVLRDNSGFGRSGTLANFDTAACWVVQNGYTSLLFDAVNDVVNIPAIALGSEFTISFWVKGSWNRTFASGSDTTPIALTSLSATSFAIYINGSSVLTVTVPDATIKLYHYCIVYRSGVMLELWVDGVLAGSTTHTATLSSSTFHFGDRPAGGRAFAGHQTDYMIFNRAITQSEVILLSRNPGIAYETIHRRSYKASAAAPASTANNLMLLGVG